MAASRNANRAVAASPRSRSRLFMSSLSHPVRSQPHSRMTVSCVRRVRHDTEVQMIRGAALLAALLAFALPADARVTRIVLDPSADSDPVLTDGAPFPIKRITG